MAQRAELLRGQRARLDWWGGGSVSGSDCMCTLPACVAANLLPPTVHMACACACLACWRCSARYVVQTAAQPGFFSHAKAACHESLPGCGLRARPRWLLGYGCAFPGPCCAPLFLTSNTYVGVCTCLLCSCDVPCGVSFARCVSPCHRTSQWWAGVRP